MVIKWWKIIYNCKKRDSKCRVKSPENSICSEAFLPCSLKPSLYREKIDDQHQGDRYKVESQSRERISTDYFIKWWIPIIDIPDYFPFKIQSDLVVIFDPQPVVRFDKCIYKIIINFCRNCNKKRSPSAMPSPAGAGSQHWKPPSIILVCTGDL